MEKSAAKFEIRRMGCSTCCLACCQVPYIPYTYMLRYQSKYYTRYAVGFTVRWKSTFSFYSTRHSHNNTLCCTENVENWSFSGFASPPQNESELSPSSIHTQLFPASPGAQLQEITVSNFWVQPWVEYDFTIDDFTIVHRIENREKKSLFRSDRG